MDDGDRRKRKITEEDSDEEKMERFFALVKSTRELRERMNFGIKEKASENKPPAAAVWNPTFKPEDFADPPEKTVEKPAAAEGGKRGSDGEKGGDEELDLNLSL
ncbi:protein NIM1-INTERACTING 3 [Andrographis paniculata]|uniref:protein NIM1-INTERACTING 3 n=1 Tax=Andrographis paniculata TaxID=175694 RepID=UPI0021E92112|nr:protein NIM1-INTERACTING 3 [Andrographis paniculata]